MRSVLEKLFVLFFVVLAVFIVINRRDLRQSIRPDDMIVMKKVVINVDDKECLVIDVKPNQCVLLKKSEEDNERISRVSFEPVRLTVVVPTSKFDGGTYPVDSVNRSLTP